METSSLLKSLKTVGAGFFWGVCCCSCKLVMKFHFSFHIHFIPIESICALIQHFLPVFPSPLSIDGLLVSDGLFILESALKQKQR